MERAASLGGFRPALFRFLIIEIPFCEMKAGSLRSVDELGALRESASSPAQGEVCLEVCSGQCFSLPSSF